MDNFYNNFWNKWNESDLNKKARYSQFLDGLKGYGTVLSGGIVYPDIYESGTKSAHFDQMDYNAIVKNFDEIKTETSLAASNYRAKEITEYSLGVKVGRILHSIQDFYSHSNYVELYIQAYGKEKLKDIPTFEDALSDSKFKRFAMLLKYRLKTGDYPGTGAGSHKEMNHDVGEGSTYAGVMPETKGKKVTAESKAAEAVAVKATTQYLESIGEQISDHD